VHVEIWSDIACPWCYVGKRRFEAAVGAFESDEPARVTWRSFELDPGAPRVRDVDSATHLARKYGTSHEQALAMHANLAQLGAEDGLELNFDRVRGGNTFDAHRLVHHAAAHDMQAAMVERLMRAYFTEGEAIGDPAVLERLAAEAGVPAAADVVHGDAYADAVRDDERTAAELGITAVPCFVVDRRLAVSGAQPPEVLAELLRRASPAAAA
jgi:predicted DsbA family dithiol-disulfide isomerase